MGHAFNTALIETVVRFQRLQGKNVVCLPGTDLVALAVHQLLFGPSIRSRLRALCLKALT